MFKHRSAFTLIELLIVVAIIAILAAIAVPNFLEAQTRAKVSRAKSDLRTLAVGQEQYFVDWNSYTNRDSGDSWAGMQGWRQLTTPVGYVTTIPRDAFGDARFPSGSRKRLEALYELGTGKAGIGRSGSPNNPQVGFPSNTFEMSSHGPDNIDDTLDAANFGGGHQFGWGEVRFPWVEIPPNDPAAAAEASSLIYDTTNGTKSAGNILRFGGVKPPGLVFSVLYAHTSSK